MQPKPLVTSQKLIISQLDYCNCLLMGAPNFVIQSLQKAPNSAARLILTTPVITTLHNSCKKSKPKKKKHLFPITERINYKVLSCYIYMVLLLPTFLNCYMSTFRPVRLAPLRIFPYSSNRKRPAVIIVDTICAISVCTPSVQYQSVHHLCRQYHALLNVILYIHNSVTGCCFGQFEASFLFEGWEMGVGRGTGRGLKLKRVVCK